MIHTIREAFNELLAENDWMDNETRAVAKEKADQMNERIGYPELLTNPKELSSEYIMVRESDNLHATCFPANRISLITAFLLLVVSHTRAP